MEDFRIYDYQSKNRSNRMRRDRPAFAFMMALSLVAIISIVLIVLIAMFYRSSIENESTYNMQQEETTIVGNTKSGINSYLTTLEDYDEKMDEDFLNASTQSDNELNIVTRSIEIGEHSIYKTIDDIVAKATDKEKKK